MKYTVVFIEEGVEVEVKKHLTEKQMLSETYWWNPTGCYDRSYYVIEEV